MPCPLAPELTPPGHACSHLLTPGVPSSGTRPPPLSHSEKAPRPPLSLLGPSSVLPQAPGPQGWCGTLLLPGPSGGRPPRPGPRDTPQRPPPPPGPATMGHLGQTLSPALPPKPVEGGKGSEDREGDIPVLGTEVFLCRFLQASDGLRRLSGRSLLPVIQEPVPTHREGTMCPRACV